MLSPQFVSLIEEAYGTLPPDEMMAEHAAISRLLRSHGHINVYRSELHHSVHIGGENPPSPAWVLVHTEYSDR